ncbi:ABC transporter substrate-binding protein [Ammoniphilus sp. YIM 78166]|uniref:ABC transporter substrate-binding protein n=1 Tax=Ammoniphilus sp. YIM 78166 TaxID=1644106 RepID=UPI00106FD1BB|nr:ABC transporter substrate-binding protein [Ammoniphilus sp. YIM 78166]
MKKQWFKQLGLLSCLLLTACGGAQTTNAPAESAKTEAPAPAAQEKLKIGITQIIEHPALDAAREGFIAALKDNGYIDGETIVIDFQSAQGDPSTVNTIAQKFASDKKDAILAISTPSAQSIVKTTEGTDIPVFFTAITDPLKAKLVDNIEKPGKNVTGYSDTHPEAIKRAMGVIPELFPDVKTVGIIYNSGEANSVVNVDNAKNALAELGLKAVEVNASNATEVKQAAESLVGRADVIYVPKDNTAVAALKAIVKVAEDNKVPMFVGEMDSVKNGGFAGFGVDYFDLGYDTGKMAVKVLKGEAKTGDLAVQFPAEISLAVNKEAAANEGIDLEKLMPVIEKYNPVFIEKTEK